LNKQKVIDLFIQKLSEELAVIEQAAKAAHEAATHEESKAEDQHDTRGLEASYLAGAQAQRAGELQRQILAFRQISAQPTERIAEGALVELDLAGKRSHCIYARVGGGFSVQTEGKTIQVITPLSPLGEALEGKRAGDSVEVDLQSGTREYEIIAVS
jgi:transcription elongation GreA/GreB family factor